MRDKYEVERLISELAKAFKKSNTSDFYYCYYEDLETVISLINFRYETIRFNLSKVNPEDCSREQLVEWLKDCSAHEFQEHVVIKILELDLYLCLYPDDMQIVAYDDNWGYISRQLEKDLTKSRVYRYSLRPDYENLKSKGFTLI